MREKSGRRGQPELGREEKRRDAKKEEDRVVLERREIVLGKGRPEKDGES